jgi:hypothetical protein
MSCAGLGSKVRLSGNGFETLDDLFESIVSSQAIKQRINPNQYKSRVSAFIRFVEVRDCLVRIVEARVRNRKVERRDISLP